MTQQAIRGFEVITKYQNETINLPKRATHHAAGYDIEAAETVVLPSYWRLLITYFLKDMKQWIFQHPMESKSKEAIKIETLVKPTLIPTGLKAYCMEDEYYMLINRSSGPKKGLLMANSIGIIDADYYGNESNDGHFFFQYFNCSDHDIEIKKGDVIGQVIFQKFLITDDDKAEGIRKGGIGSTDKK